MEIKLRTLFIWILLFSSLVIGMRLFYTDLSDIYSVSRNENFTAFDDYMDDTYSQIQEMEDKLETSEVTGIDAVDMAIYFVRGSYQALKLTLKLPTLYTGLITEVTTMLRLPLWVKTLTLGIVIVTVVFLIVSAALKHDV